MRELRCNKYIIKIRNTNAYNYNRAVHTLQNLFDCIKCMSSTSRNCKFRVSHNKYIVLILALAYHIL